MGEEAIASVTEIARLFPFAIVVRAVDNTSRLFTKNGKEVYKEEIPY